MRQFTGQLKKLTYKLGLLSSFVLLSVAGLSFSFGTSYAQSASISTGVNCDANAVIYCGATSLSSLAQKYTNGDRVNSAASIHHIYSYFGITSSDIASMSSGALTVSVGSVTKTGNVYNSSGTLIADNVRTAGRQNISGSTAETVDGTTFYVRTPSVSFQSNELDAYIVTSGGKFDFAILASCGNPVIGSTVAPTKPTKPTTTTPVAKHTTTVTPTETCSGGTANSSTNSNSAQGGNCSANTVVVNNQPPAQVTVSSQPAPAATTTTTSLVNTGPGDTIGLFVGATTIGTLGYHFFIRRRLSRAIINKH